MSVAKDLKTFLVDGGIADTENVYISRVPSTNLTQDNTWAIVAATPGFPAGGNLSKWKLTYTFTLLFRHSDGETVYDQDDALQALFATCPNFSHYRVLGAIISSMTELDLSTDQVHVGSWQVQITILNGA